MATNVDLAFVFCGVWGHGIGGTTLGFGMKRKKELEAASTCAGQRHKCTKAGRQAKQVTEQPILALIKMARKLVKCNNKEQTRIRTTAFH